MKLLHHCERIIILVLLAMMMFAVLLSTVDLGVVLFRELLKPPRFLLNVEKLLEIFGFFMMVLIGLELLETIKSYLELNRVHIEIFKRQTFCMPSLHPTSATPASTICLVSRSAPNGA